MGGGGHPSLFSLLFRSKKKKTKKEKKKKYSVGYKAEEPGDYPATAHFVSELKKKKKE